MSSIGPQLPPHLSKRKRDDHDADADATGPQPPPHKTARRVGATNDDEIALDWGDDDSDDDDNTGPAVPPPKTAAPPATAARPDAPTPGPRRPSPAPAPRAAIGPSMPPPQASANGDEIDLGDDSGSDDDDDDSTGPAAQPARRPPPPPPPAATAPRPVMGPAPPPAALSERPSEDPASDSDNGYGPRREEEQDVSGSDDDDEDDDYGPAPADSKAARRNQERHVSQRHIHAAGIAASTAAVRFIRQEHDAAFAEQEAAAAAAANKSKRDEWMVVPPPPMTGPGDADPTKIRARGFATGRAAAAAASSVHPSSGLGSMWTETALQRAERVLSRGAADFADNPGGGGGGGGSRSGRRHQQGEGEEARETAIRLYTEQTRGKSMYEEHQAALKEGKKPVAGAKKEEEDDPSKRAFDREKDMAVGGRITQAQRRDLMKQAADFGGRFQKGKYL